MLNYLIFGITYAFACVVQPGPFQAFLFSQSITNGWRKTLPLVFAPLLSDLPVIILVLLVLTNIPGDVLRVIQCFGGLFLLYLAYNAYITWKKFDANINPEAHQRQNFFKAALLNLLNPNPYLSWSLIMGPLFIKGWNEGPSNATVLLISFYGSFVVYSVGMIVLFSAARKFGPRINRMALGFSVIAFAAFGFYQIWSGIF